MFWSGMSAISRLKKGEWASMATIRVASQDTLEAVKALLESSGGKGVPKCFGSTSDSQ